MLQNVLISIVLTVFPMSAVALGQESSGDQIRSTRCARLLDKAHAGMNRFGQTIYGYAYHVSLATLALRFKLDDVFEEMVERAPPATQRLIINILTAIDRFHRHRIQLEVDMVLRSMNRPPGLTQDVAGIISQVPKIVRAQDPKRAINEAILTRRLGYARRRELFTRPLARVTTIDGSLTPAAADQLLRRALPAWTSDKDLMAFELSNAMFLFTANGARPKLFRRHTLIVLKDNQVVASFAQINGNDAAQK